MLVQIEAEGSERDALSRTNVVDLRVGSSKFLLHKQTEAHGSFLFGDEPPAAGVPVFSAVEAESDAAEEYPDEEYGEDKED